jgi:PTH1 family peptidyl-tRNA hydrolase
MKLVIGLGNIGIEYDNTRHNIGFTCLQRFAHEKNIRFKSLSNYLYSRFKSSLLMLPQTYMNRSGDAYASAMIKYKTFDEILVIMDDIDLPLGEVRIKPNGGSGGHKGLSSIINAAMPNCVPRIRIGIGRDKTQRINSFVLDRFSDEEMVILNPLITRVNQWIDIFVEAGFNSMLDEYSQFMKKPIPSKKDGINRPKEETND